MTWYYIINKIELMNDNLVYTEVEQSTDLDYILKLNSEYEKAYNEIKTIEDLRAFFKEKEFILVANTKIEEDATN